MKITNTALVNIKGEAMKVSSMPNGLPKEDDPLLLVSDVLLNAALSPATNQPHEPAKAAERYKFALTLYNLAADAEIDVPSALAAELTRDVARVYNNVTITAQIYELLK